MKKLKYTLNSGYIDWQAMLPVEFNQIHGVKDVLDSTTFKSSVWNGKEKINFQLISSRTNDPSTEELEKFGIKGFQLKYPHGKPLHQPGTNGQEFRDILEWGSIILTEHQVTESPKNGGGNTYRIISPKLKQVLEQFNLPPHRFYPAEVTHEITGEKRPYYLFHLTYEKGNYLQSAYWPMIESVILKKETNSDQLIKRFEKGSFNDFQDYIKKTNDFERKHTNIKIEGRISMSTPEGREARKLLRKYSSKEPYYVYNDHYDLLGFDTTMIISEDLKNALDKNFPEKELYLEYANMVDVVTGYQPGEALPF